MPDDELRKQREREKFRAQQTRGTNRGRRNNERGMQFHYGMAEKRGETRENGWVREHTERGLGADGKGSRRIDQARLINAQNREFSEYKSGRIDGDAKTLKQLGLDRELLASGRYVSGRWVTVEGSQISKEVREQLQSLEREFPGKFQHIVVPESEAQKAIDLGKALTRNLQYELPDVHALAVEQQALAKNREKGRTQQNVREWEARRKETQRLALTIEKHRRRRQEKAQAQQKRQDRATREAADRKERDRTLADRKRDVTRVVETNVRRIEAAREQGIAFPAQDLHEARRDVVHTMRKVRRAEKSQTREMLRGIGVTGQDAKTMERTLAAGRERNRVTLMRGIDAIGTEAVAVAELESRAKQERERQRVLEREHRERQERSKQGLDRALQIGVVSPKAYAGLQAVLGAQSREPTEAEARRYEQERREQGRTRTRDNPGLERGLGRER